MLSLKTTNTDAPNTDKLNTDVGKKVYVVKADRRIIKRTQQVWVLKNSN